MHPTQNQVSPAPTRPTVADSLRRAALYLIRHGWTQDVHYGNQMTPVILRSPLLPAADVLGALVLATTGQAMFPAEVATETGANADRELRAAADYLTDWLGLNGDLDGAPIDSFDALLLWNDSPWQDQAHVIDGLLSAAADYDGTTYNPGTHRPYAADFAALDIKTAGAR